MTNQFLVYAREILLLDENSFYLEGGQELRFGELDRGVVRLYATGSTDAITGLARNIIAHRTAAL